MRAVHPRRLVLLLILCSVAVVPALVGAACGAAEIAAGTSETVDETDYSAILADRYDDVFPDDRVRTVRILMDDADWEAMQSNVRSKEYFKADIWLDEEQVQDVAVRTKGSSSLSAAVNAESFRAGLKVDFNYYNSSGSYQGLKKIVLNNGFSDPTMMREFLGYEVMAFIGLPTPRACFADVWVNDEHIGLYTMVEAVDGRFLSENFADSDGNLFKPEIKAGALDWTEADAVAESDDRAADGEAGAEAGQEQQAGAGDLLSRNADYLTSVGLKTNEDSADYSGLYELLEVLNSDPADVSAADLEGVLQVDEVLRYVAVSVALVHLDNYIGMGHNYYLYEDGGRFWIVPWDLNMAFGGFSSGLSEEQPVGYFIDEPTAASVDQYPLVEQLLDEPEYLETYHEYLQRLIDGPFSVESMSARIDEIATLIRPYVENDDHKFYTTEEFEQGLTQNLTWSGGSGAVVPGGKFIGLKYFVEQRTASIAAQLDGSEPAGNGDGSGNGGKKGLAGAGAAGAAGQQGAGAQAVRPGQQAQGQQVRPQGQQVRPQGQ